MNQAMEIEDMYEVGQIVRVKKKHPCGSVQWEIVRVGMDIKLKCCVCGRLVMVSRNRFAKMVKQGTMNS